MYATGYLPLLAKKMPENIRGVKVLNKNHNMLSDSVMAAAATKAHKKVTCIRKKFRCFLKVSQKLLRLEDDTETCTGIITGQRCW